jgi:Zn-dependent metalloprotease
MATDDQGTAMAQADRLAKQRRRRRMLTYGGLGGTVVAAAIAVYTLFFSVVVYHTVEEALTEVARRHPSADVRRDTTTGYASTLSNLEATTTKSQQVDAGSAGEFAVDFVETPEVAAVIGVPKQATLQVTGTFADPQRSGYNVVRIQQFVNQVRLFGADIMVSVRSGPAAAISSVATRAATVPELDMQPAIDEVGARQRASAHYATLAADARSRLAKDGQIGDVERVVFDPKRFGLAGSATLAWRVRQASLQIFVDAKDGRIISSYDDRHSALNRLTHDCGGTQCLLVLNEEGSVLKPPGKPGADAILAHNAAAAAHGYYQKMFGRDGFDDVLGTGGKASIESFVQVSDLGNALWLPDAQRLEFGVGWTTLDIAAHEYTHAVTQFGPNLVYLGESGAVNEFFSDFFAAMIERAVASGTPDWRIGEGVRGFSGKRPLRNMADPHNGAFDKTKPFDPSTNAGQPHHFNEIVTTTDTICASTFLADNGCVHFNSGILAKAAVLAIDGGTFQGTTVVPIPRDKVEQIMFRTLMLGGVTSSSNLKDTANGAVVACNQLAAGAVFGITAKDCTAFTQAFTAVGLR